MKTFSEFVANDSMYYRHILTYNFSKDETRSSFMELIGPLGYIEAEDQSTYVLPYDDNLNIEPFCDAIIKWSSDKKITIEKDDFVQIFHLCFAVENSKVIRKIASKYLKYNDKTKGLAIK